LHTAAPPPRAARPNASGRRAGPNIPVQGRHDTSLAHAHVRHPLDQHAESFLAGRTRSRCRRSRAACSRG